MASTEWVSSALDELWSVLDNKEVVPEGRPLYYLAFLRRATEFQSSSSEGAHQKLPSSLPESGRSVMIFGTIAIQH
jgi:hypothetical protein